LVREWEGKEIVFPANRIFTRYGADTLDYQTPDTDGKIVLYIDSMGCTSCKLQFNRWRKIMHEMDSIAGMSVPFVFVFHPKNKRDLSELSYLMKRDDFNYPVWIDVDDAFNKTNKLSDNRLFHSFLIDGQNNVVAMGNPFDNPKIKELYLNILNGKTEQSRPDSNLTEISVDQPVVDLGEFDWETPKTATFRLNNRGNKRLVINDVVPSCGCISVDFPKAPVDPGKELVITATYKAEKPGYFRKTLTVYTNTKTPLQLTVTGSAN
jgi:hypothetical protein